MRTVAATLLLLCLAAPAWADSLLCPGGVISTGDRMGQVRSRCGEPLHRDSYYAEFRGRLTRVEEWTYHISDLDRFLLFENGRLVKIIYNP